MSTDNKETETKQGTILGVSISFVAKFEKYQDEYERFLMWCLDNNGKMTMEEWNLKKAAEFKRRRLDIFFNEC